MIRNAKIEDIEAIVCIISNAWKSAYVGIVDPVYSNNVDKKRLENIFRNNIINNKEVIFVNDNNGIDGLISGKYGIGTDDCEIVGLYVSPQQQGKGIGERLFRRMEEEFKRNRKKQIVLWTLDNAKNNGFYKKMKGKKVEYKELMIGNKKYSGVRFQFDIDEET